MRFAVFAEPVDDVHGYCGPLHRCHLSYERYERSHIRAYLPAGVADEIQASFEHLIPIHDAIACPVPIHQAWEGIREEPSCEDSF